MTTDEKLDLLLNEIKEIKEEIGKVSAKQQKMDIKLDDISYRIDTIEYQTKKATRRTEDQFETIITVLEGKGILPKAL